MTGERSIHTNAWRAQRAGERDEGDEEMAMAERVEGDDVGGGGGGGGSSAMDLTEGGACVAGVSTHDGHYMHYNIFGNFFEVSAKYVPPIRPIGRGAYGIVWCVFFFLLSPSSSPQLFLFQTLSIPLLFLYKIVSCVLQALGFIDFLCRFWEVRLGFFLVVVVDRNC